MTKPDTDGDGLNDGEEYIYGTNPLKTDTDGDGFSDYAEVKAGSDPLDPKSFPQIIGDVNGDGQVDLADAVLSLQVLSGLVPENISPSADINGDGKIGMAEAIYVMQKVAGF